jgi:hypothetical protein
MMPEFDRQYNIAKLITKLEQDMQEQEGKNERIRKYHAGLK